MKMFYFSLKRKRKERKVMQKEKLVQEIARRIDGCTRADVKVLLDTYAEVVLDTLAGDKNETVVLPGLGKFSVREVSEKSGVSPFDGKQWVKPAHNEVKFTVTPSVKEI